MSVEKHLCAILCLGLLCSFAYARDLNQDEALSLRQQGIILPLEQFIERALGLHPGSRLLEAELEEKHDVYVYEFELLTPQGVVRELKFDARDSRLLKDEED
ncbi:PepSY domain-containing protein [Pseudomonas sp. CDFA 602]|uniref:PepSY domain-containing protein n=1 Tax=Pseudomonas californiensis TaxID=2829823 RepID=UPI001E2C8CA5|nr:PepSY domain-containing protein [Pseudomonas californiensis]MCD5995569.1 PepSY domain-containing protein [Pseudomonas californiensis]MCD6001163.1 PepSY domain-containing protein [Pseudomonas californiensis]